MIHIDSLLKPHRLLDTARHADFEIICRDHRFKVQKAILAAASGYYDRLCDSQFSEGSTARSTLDEDPALVARMLIFAYTHTYHTEPLQNLKCVNSQFKTVPDPFGEQPSDDETLDYETRAQLHVQLYGLADKYEFGHLKHQARQRFLIAFSDADEYSSSCYEGIPNDDTSSLPATLASGWAQDARLCEAVYATTPHNDRGLRDVVLVHILQTSDGTDNEECRAFLESREMMQLISTTPDLAVDLATMRMSAWSHECEGCGTDPRVLARRCGCDKFDRCSNDECLRQAKLNSFCNWCGRLGTVNSWTDDDMDALPGPSEA